MASMRARSLFLLENSALASSTLLVKCSSTTCSVSVIAFFPDDLSRTPYRWPPTITSHKLPGSGGKTSLVAATSQSVRFARSLATPFQSARPHLHTYIHLSLFVRSSERVETRVHAGRVPAGRALRPCGCWDRYSLTVTISISHIRISYITFK